MYNSRDADGLHSDQPVALRRGSLAILEGRLLDALALTLEYLSSQADMGRVRFSVDSVEQVAQIAVLLSRDTTALTLFASAAAYRKEAIRILTPIEKTEQDNLIKVARSRLNSVTAQMAWVKGLSMSIRDAHLFARTKLELWSTRSAPEFLSPMRESSYHSAVENKL